jgi:hypothetical protein
LEKDVEEVRQKTEEEEERKKERRRRVLGLEKQSRQRQIERRREREHRERELDAQMAEISRHNVEKMFDRDAREGEYHRRHAIDVREFHTKQMEEKKLKKRHERVEELVDAKKAEREEDELVKTVEEFGLQMAAAVEEGGGDTTMIAREVRKWK